MPNQKIGMHPFARRARVVPQRAPMNLAESDLLAADTIFEAPEGYESAGVVIVENYMLVKDTVPDAVHQRADNNGDVIIKLRSESIVKDGRLAGDRIVAEFFVPRFLCC